MLSAAYYEEYSACHYYDTCCVEDCCTDATGGWKDCTCRVDYLYTSYNTLFFIKALSASTTLSALLTDYIPVEL
ncbi:MAG: hypothetical protein V8R59_14150 [Enterocloster sp.]